MSTALALNAQATLINGQGLAFSPSLLASVSSFHGLATVNLVATTWAAAASTLGNVELFAALGSLNSGVTKAQWLIDNYPPSFTPVSSIGYAAWATDYDTGAAIPAAASFSSTVYSQAQAPFQNGINEFANVFLSAYSYANEVFDTVSSTKILKDKTYGQHGVGYKNNADLATNGLGTSANLLSNVVSTWGTMYDINNISQIGDVYVFGQNLLNQGFGSYGDWDKKLANVGLDTTNLSVIPKIEIINSAEPAVEQSATPYGSIGVPLSGVATTTTSIPGRSEDVVLSIYRSVTGANLQAIVSGSRFVKTNQNSTLTTLADYLDFTKVVPSSLRARLTPLGINSFKDFGSYVQTKIGQGAFSSWSDLAQTLNKIVVPSQQYTTTTGNTTVVLSASAQSTLNAATGTGSGSLNHLIMRDFLGAAAGLPYVSLFTSLVKNYNSLPVSGLVSALQTLKSAVVTYGSEYDAAVPIDPFIEPDISPVTSAVAAVNAAVNAIPDSGLLTLSQNFYITILTRLQTEYTNLNKAGATFNAGSAQVRNSFAKQFATTATDKTKFETYEIIDKLITNNAAGDVLRAAIAEEINGQILGQRGVGGTNDPDPNLAMAQSQRTGVSVNTYISQRK